MIQRISDAELDAILSSVWGDGRATIKGQLAADLYDARAALVEKDAEIKDLREQIKDEREDARKAVGEAEGRWNRG